MSNTNRSGSREAVEEAFEKFEAEEAEEIEETVDEVEEDTELEGAEEVTAEAEEEVTAEAEEEDTDDPEYEAEVKAAATAKRESEDVRAPQSWRAKARESWAKVPPEAREEIQRRERDIEKKLGEISEKSARANAFEQAIAPFQQTIAIEANGDAILATRNLMGIATRLRQGSAYEKAQIISSLVNIYGVDVQALDSALAGESLPPSPSHMQAPQPVADPRVDQLWQETQASKEQRRTEARTNAEKFIASKEFGEDLRDSIADIIELAHKRGRPVTLEEAYERAVKLDPEISSIVQSRTTTQSSGSSLKRKRRAASSIKGSPTGGDSTPTPKTRADAISQAWDQLANG